MYDEPETTTLRMRMLYAKYWLLTNLRLGLIRTSPKVHQAIENWMLRVAIASSRVPASPDCRSITTREARSSSLKSLGHREWKEHDTRFPPPNQVRHNGGS